MKKILLFFLVSLAPILADAAASPISTEETPFPFSVDDSNITLWNGNEYVPLFIKGINLGIAVPGTFPGELRASRVDYGRWLQQIRDAGFNTVRLYTLHYPWFYEVLDSFNLANPQSPLFLFQGVWLEEELPGFTGDLHQLTGSFIDEIETNVDCIHGNRVIPHRFGKAYGEYSIDVSRWVMGYIIGREVYAREVLLTDKTNAGISSYTGRYFSIRDTKPSEAWFVKKLDHLVSHEYDNYNTQRPVSISSWPTLDPLHHPTELDRHEDTTFIDLSYVDFSAAPAGMFISYHAYPYYPDFVSRSPQFRDYYDAWGNNSYLGYLTALKNHYRTMPLIIAEFGTSSSVGIAHFASNGIHHGGADQQKLAKDNLRMLDNIYRSGAGGGMQFSWMDEWFKWIWFTATMDYMPDRRILWHNLVSAEQNFGLVGFRSKDVSFRQWESFGDHGQVRSVEAYADYTFFNIRLNMNGFLGIMDTLWVAIDTYDAMLGESVVPTGHILENRAEFLLMITNHACKLFVTHAYDQFGKWHRMRMPGQYYRSVPSDGDHWNIVRFKNNYFEQEIQYIGNLNFKRLDHPLSSNDLVILDTTKIDIRLPWNLIHFSDPSEMTVIHDYHDIPGYQDTLSDGIALSLIHGDDFYSTLSRFSWDHWQTACGAEEYLKDSYFIMKENLWKLPGNPIARSNSYKVPENGILRVSSENGLLKNDLSLDGTGLTAWLYHGPQHGSLEFNPDGSFSYVAESGTQGTLSFTYRVSAGGKMSEPAVVDLEIENLIAGPGFLEILPNPSDGIIRINTSSLILSIEVFNSMGGLVFNRQVSAKTTQLDLTGYPPGIYTVRVSNREHSVSRKIILSY